MNKAHGLTVLCRIAQRWPSETHLLRDALTGRLPELIETAIEVTAQEGEPLSTVLDEVVKTENDPEIARRVHLFVASCTSESLPVLPVFATCLEVMLKTFRAHWLPRPTREQRDMIIMLTLKLGGVCTQLGRFGTALGTLQVALSEYERMAPRDQSAAPALLDTLLLLANVHRHLGELDQALGYARRARAVGQRYPKLNGFRLAAVLVELAGLETQLNNQQSALLTLQEAEDVYAALDQDNDDVAANVLVCKSNRCAVLAGLGRHREVIPLLEEVVREGRQLADVDPQRYGPVVADALGNLSKAQGRLGMVEALESVRAAVNGYRPFARIAPGMFAGRLAALLEQLSDTLVTFGQPAAATAPAEEALDYRRTMARLHCSHSNALAKALITAARAYSGANRIEDGIRCAREAATIIRSKAAPEEDDSETLAWALAALAILYRKRNLRRDALAFAAEAAEIWKRDGVAFPFVNICRHMAADYIMLGLPSDAERTLRDAAYAEFDADWSRERQYMEERVQALLDLADLQWAAPEGAPAARESAQLARSILHEMTEASPSVHSRACALLGMLSGDANDYESALEHFNCAVTAARCSEHSSAKAALAGTLQNRAIVLRHLGRPDEVLLDLVESACLARELARGQCSVEMWKGYTQAAFSVGCMYKHTGRLADLMELCRRLLEDVKEAGDLDPRVFANAFGYAWPVVNIEPEIVDALQATIEPVLSLLVDRLKGTQEGVAALNEILDLLSMGRGQG